MNLEYIPVPFLPISFPLPFFPPCLSSSIPSLRVSLSPSLIPSHPYFLSPSLSSPFLISLPPSLSSSLPSLLGSLPSFFLPSLFLPSFPPLLFPEFLYSFCVSPSPRNRPLNIARGWRSAVSSPSRVWGAQPKSNLMYLALRPASIWLLLQKVVHVKVRSP